MQTLTKAVMRRMWPRAPQAKIDAIVEIAPRVLAQYGISTPLRLAHFMAQISHECGGGTINRENMNYSASRMLQIFGEGRHSARVTPFEAQQLAGHPEQIAERVYGIGNPKKAKELGNTRPGDGWRFRGGGDLQLTGGNSYKKMGQVAGVDLYNRPELIGDPRISFQVAAAEFEHLKCLPAADADDVRLVTRRVNGGYNGLEDRIAWLRKWKVELPGLPEREPDPEEPPENPRGAEPAPEDRPETPAKSKSLWTIILERVAAIGTAIATFGGMVDWKLGLVILLGIIIIGGGLLIYMRMTKNDIKKGPWLAKLFGDNA